MENCPCCQKEKKTPREEEFIKNLKARLNRISGQLTGVSNMVGENRYCSDILIQIAAIESALKEVGFLILKDHLKTCVADDIKQDNLESLEEAIEISKKLL